MNGPNDVEFEMRLRESLDGLKRPEDKCPDAQELARCYASELSDERANEVRRHVEACGKCDLLVERLRQFDEAAQSGAPDLPPSAWQEIDQRLTNRMEALLNAQAKPATAPNRGGLGGMSQTMAAFLRRPAVGYAIALALCYPAYLGIRPKPNPASETPKAVAPAPAAKILAPPFTAQPAPVLDLDGVRGPLQPSNRVQLTEQDRFFVLSFFVPIRTDRRYTATILNEAGTTIAPEEELPQPDHGNFVLVCAREPFRPGEYRLIVSEFDHHTGQVSRRVTFRFRI